MSAAKLVDTIPLFPLHKTILLPGSVLPLHIFESRYRLMVEHVLENPGLLIGIIQPAAQDSKKLCEIGCAGKIEQSQQLPKGNYLIQLHGESRFKIVDELETETPYRQARVEYSSFPHDTENLSLSKDTDILYQNFKEYSARNKLKIEWDKIEDIPANYLVNLLSMNLDFSGIEKQTLLESPDLDSRLDDLICLMEMSSPNEILTDFSPNFLN
ncbi:MAG: LON peptidase substrate-binding domain-containing protein [SAR324 cluster bacterium]|nr:LON peptidase substrate-binding domain-containing protein [SAR324 cluster bacterium]MBL7035949.1 LON peptidase substrate-binding domain-containing protein [SAR324 cluster bacterium]